MQLYRTGQIPRFVGLVCRQSRVANVLGGTILSAVLISAAWFWWRIEAPWPVWGACGLLAAIVVPMILGSAVSSLRHDNWLLAAEADGVWINIRSHQNWRFESGETVLFIPYAEIASARRHSSRFSRPSSNGGTHHTTIESLELRLKSDDTHELSAALVAERRREGPARSIFPGVTVRGRTRHYPVSLPSPNVVRIAWRGTPGNMVTPGVGRVISEMARHVAVAEDARTDQANWEDLEDEQLDDLIMELVEIGRTIDAAKLLVDRRGMSLTGAKRFVDDLAEANV